MKWSLLLLISCALSYQAWSQTPRFAKYPIQETGAYLYTPAQPEWEKSLSEDQSEVYTTEVVHNGITYGAIVVRFSENLGDNKEELEALLMSYMSYLGKDVFAFTNVMDYGTGHTLESNPAAYGMISYAEDAEKNDYKLKGWIDGRMLAVLYTKSREEMNYNIQELFLNGFRFPDK